MTITFPAFGQSILSPSSAQGGALSSRGDTEMLGQPDFASLIEEPGFAHFEAAPAAAFNALGVFGRGASVEAEGEALVQGTKAVSSLDQRTMSAAAPIPSGGVPAEMPEFAADTRPGLKSGTSAPEAVLGPVTNGPMHLDAVAPPLSLRAEPLLDLSETGSDRSASPLARPLPGTRPQSVSVTVVLENGAIQVLLRSSDPGLDHDMTLRNRIEELAREHDVSVNGFRLNGVALPLAASGVTDGYRSN